MRGRRGRGKNNSKNYSPQFSKIILPFEEIKQLIHLLKNSNPANRIDVINKSIEFLLDKASIILLNYKREKININKFRSLIAEIFTLGSELFQAARLLERNRIPRIPIIFDIHFLEMEEKSKYAQCLLDFIRDKDIGAVELTSLKINASFFYSLNSQNYERIVHPHLIQLAIYLDLNVYREELV